MRQQPGPVKSGSTVQREHMGSLQHNKFIAVSGKTQMALCGSNRLFVARLLCAENNAVTVQGKDAVQLFFDAFDGYSKNSSGKGAADVAGFAATASANMASLGLAGIDAKIAFSPHAGKMLVLQTIGDDIQNSTTSSLFYSLAFLAQTSGPIKDAIRTVSRKDNIFVYGIADKAVSGIVLQKPDGNLAPVSPAALSKNLPEPFKSEPTGGSGVRMHHKFVVIDFDKPTARVYMGSYNFSKPADLQNGENLLLFRDRRIAVSYMVEALTMFDHYHFRLLQQTKAGKKQLLLSKPPRKKGDKPWWDEDYTDPVKVRDRELFS